MIILFYHKEVFFHIPFQITQNFVQSRFGAFMRVLEVYFVVTLKCDQDRTERTVAVAITIVAVEIEHACTRTIIVIASACEERIARVRKVRVIAVPRTTA